MDDFIYDREHDLDLTAAQARRLYRMAVRPDGLLDDDATTRALARIGLADAEPTTWRRSAHRLNARGGAAAKAVRARVDAGDVEHMGRGERRMIVEYQYEIPNARLLMPRLLDDPLPVVRRKAVEYCDREHETLPADMAARLARSRDPLVRACRAVVRTAPIEAYANETDPTVISVLIGEHRYDEAMVDGWLRSHDEKVFAQALPAVDDDRLERLLRKGVFPDACVHEWVKRKHPLEWDLVAHIIPALDPDGYAAYSIADHVIHVPDDMIGTLPKTLEYRIREAAEAQAKANRLMRVFADPNGETARKAITEAEARA